MIVNRHTHERFVLRNSLSLTTSWCSQWAPMHHTPPSRHDRRKRAGRGRRACAMIRPDGSSRRRRRPAHQRGAVYVETLITLPIVIYFALITWQLADLFLAHLFVKHAAQCAARAAAVIGADDPIYYGGQSLDDLDGGARLEDVREAASRALAPRFGTGSFDVKLSGQRSVGQMLTARVSATYKCHVPALNVVCLGGASRLVTADGNFPYQRPSLVAYKP